MAGLRPAWLALGLMLLAFAAAAAEPPRKLALQLQWRHQFEFAGFYAAKEKGYYREAGLDVEIREYDPRLNQVDEVVAGRAEFGIWGPQLIAERLHGAPIQLVANYFKRSPLVILTRPELKLPSDLRGKRLMVPPGDIDTVSYRSMFRQFGLSKNDIVLVPHSFTVDEFVAGEVDAMSAFVTDQPFAVSKAGKSFNVLDPNNYGAELYDVMLFTSEPFARDNAELVRAFRQASNRGWTYALEHPDELVELILAKYNSQQRSRAALQFEAVETAKVMLPRVYPVGSIDGEKLRRMGELYVQLGEAESLDRLQGFVFDAVVPATAAPATTIEMTDAERAFVREHPRLRVSNETGWPPFDFFENGAPQGYSVGLMRLVAEKIGVQLEFVQAETWAELVEAFCARKLDLLHPTDRSQQVLRCGLLSPPIIRETTQFLTRRDFKAVRTLSDLYGSVIASPRGWEQTAQLRRLHGQHLRILETDDIQQAIEAVRDGRADATTDFGSSLHYHVNRQGYTSLKVQGVWGSGDSQDNLGALYIATRNDWAPLHGLVNKALAALSVAELQALQARWLQADAENVAVSARVALDEREHAYLAGKGEIRICTDPDSLPYERINERGQHEGILAEIAGLLGKRLGVPLVLHRTASWSDSLAALRARECDALLGATDIPSRRDAMAFTRPYLVEPLVVATRAGEVFVKDAAAIGVRPVAIIKGYSYAETLRALHPGMRIVDVESTEAGLEQVRRGQVWGYVGSMPAVAFALAKGRMLDLKIAGRLELDDELSVATRNDQPLLGAVMQKAVDSISEDERRAIVNRWVAVRFERDIDYALLWRVGLAAGVVLLGFYAWNRKLAHVNAAVQRARGQTQAALDQVEALLDNSGQGFLSFGRELRVEPGCSRECTRIFGRSPEGADLPALLSPNDPAQAAFLGKTLPLALAADEALRREAFLELLPREYGLAGHAYKADYRLLGEGRMMLVLTDISAEKRLREKLAQERLRLEFVVSALENRDEVLALLREFDDFRGRVLPDLLSFEHDPQALLVELFRQVHTFKGLFAQANLPAMPVALHGLESRLQVLRARGEALAVNDIKRELGAVDLGAELARDLAVLREKLGEAYFNAEPEIRVAASALAALETEAAELYGADSRMLQLIRQLRYEPLPALIAPCFKAAEQLARRQGKALAPLVCEGAAVLVDPAVYGPFCRTLVHLFRNAVDHGIEDADTRLLADKDETAHIRCQLRVAGNRLLLSIEDDGRGLDLDAIRRKAVDGGRLDAAAAAALDDAEVYPLIFLDGVSTREQASEVSGRGIGLAALRQELQRLGGQVRVSTETGQGTGFHFELPYVPALAPRRGDTPLQRAAHLLAPLPRMMQAFCEGHLGMEVELAATMQELSAEALFDFTAVVPLGGGLDATLGVSIERPLLLEMTRRFEPEFTAAEIPAMADSVGAEIANTLVGNATVYFTPIDRRVAMGTPEILGGEVRRVRFGRRVFRGFSGKAAAGGFMLFCVLPEETAS